MRIIYYIKTWKTHYKNKLLKFQMTGGGVDPKYKTSPSIFSSQTRELLEFANV